MKPENAPVDALDRAARYAPFLAMLIASDPALVDRLRSGDLSLPPWNDDAAVPVAKRLRRHRNALALTVAVGDLSGAFDLTAVTAALTGFADHALDCAIRSAIAERTPGAEPVGFAAIALGKQGSGELNYSSDIDPILLFDPVTLPRRPREEPADAAVRIARRVIDLLQKRDGDGYVLRVDLRLRPSPEITPIALPIDAAIGYYESQALPWERAAFIRARAAAGDVALGQRFLAAIRPFVWRRTLDFGAIHEIRAISHRIRDHYTAGQQLGPGYDLKRGRGGIREVEFFAQVHQLIHGGREPALRVPATRDALARLGAAGLIPADDARVLRDAYVLLRTIEHRVQMVDDRQTHMLPAGSALDRLAQLDGLENGDALIGKLAPFVGRSAALYDQLDGAGSDGLPYGQEALTDALTQSGFVSAPAVAARIADWRSGRYPALRSAAAKEAFEAALPTILPVLAGAADQGIALTRLDNFIERLPSAVNVFRLLEARPGLADLLIAVLSHAAPLADALARHPALLDGLIDASALQPVGSLDDLSIEMQGHDAEDLQARLDHVRRVVGEKRFALGVQIVAGSADPIDVSAGYSRLAEAAIEVLAAATIAEFVRAHGPVPGSELVILALGRLGGGALTHASDLDLVYLFTGDFAAESTGPKPLGATLYYNRLAQRISAALSVSTAAGPLYQVDTRLRPSGTQGPLVVSVDTLARYQREEAWTWEHMAFTRARPVFGSAKARAQVASVISSVLEGCRPDRDIAAEASAMRADMRTHKPAHGRLDAKLSEGGLVDLEFAVHIVQLIHRVGLDPDLGHAIPVLAGAGLVPASMIENHVFLSRLLVVTRLLAPDGDEPDDATRDLIVATMKMDDWEALLATLAATRQEVRTIWQHVSGEARG